MKYCHAKNKSKQPMEIMAIQCAALVVLILIGFMQLQTFAVLFFFWSIRGVWHNVDFMMLCHTRTLERLLTHPCTECIKCIGIFISVLQNILYFGVCPNIQKTFRLLFAPC